MSRSDVFLIKGRRREGKSRQSKGKFEFGDSLEEVVIEWKEKRERDEVRGKITQVEEVTCSNVRERTGLPLIAGLHIRIVSESEKNERAE